jgi:hypothetical protein
MLAVKLLELARNVISEDIADVKSLEVQIEPMKRGSAAPLAPGLLTDHTAFYPGKQPQETTGVQQAQDFPGYGFSTIRAGATPYSSVRCTSVGLQSATDQGSALSEQLHQRSSALPASRRLEPFQPSPASSKPVHSQLPRPCSRVPGQQANEQIAVYSDIWKRPRITYDIHHHSNQLNPAKSLRQAPHPLLSATSSPSGNPYQSQFPPPTSHENSGPTFVPVTKNTRKRRVCNEDGVPVRADGQPDKRSVRKVHKEAENSRHEPFSGPSSAPMSGFGETSDKTGGEERKNFSKRALVREGRENSGEILDTTGTGDDDEDWQSRAQHCEEMCRSMEQNQKTHAIEPKIVREVSTQCSEQRSYERPPVGIGLFHVKTSEPVASERSGSEEKVVDAVAPDLVDRLSTAGDTVLARAKVCGFLENCPSGRTTSWMKQPDE